MRRRAEESGASIKTALSLFSLSKLPGIMARRALRASAALFLLIIIALFSACNAKAADVPPEDKTPETGEELQDDA